MYSAWSHYLFVGVVSHVQALARGDHASGWGGVEGQKEPENANHDNLQSLASKIMESTLTAHSATPIGFRIPFFSSMEYHELILLSGLRQEL